MSHIRPVLFLGGCADGRRDFLRTDEIERGHRRMAHMPPPSFRPYDDLHYRDMRVETFDYELFDYLGDTAIFVYRGLDRRSVMSRLVAGYKPERG